MHSPRLLASASGSASVHPVVPTQRGQQYQGVLQIALTVLQVAAFEISCD